MDTSLRLIDLSDLGSPREVGVYESPDTIHAVHVADGIAYVAAEDAGLRIVDVSTASSPREIASVGTQGMVTDVDVVDGYAYLVDSGPCLRVIDVTTPAYPVEVGTLAGMLCMFDGVVVADGFAISGRGSLRAGFCSGS